MATPELSIEVKKVGRNMRRIECKVVVHVSLDSIWQVLTDYERYPDFTPSVAETKVIHRRDDVVRLSQISRQNLPLGLKLDAKMIFDCHEKDVETLSSGKKRQMEFKMIQGDLQSLEGRWSIEQIKKEGSKDEEDFSAGKEIETMFSYSSDIKTKLWCPINLVEGRMLNSTKANMIGILQEAQKRSETSSTALNPDPFKSSLPYTALFFL